MTGGDVRTAMPREAFSLLAHDIRLDILLALLDHWYAQQTEPQSYSALMRAVDVEDSGKFNYHLGQLRGTYLQQVDEGYVPLASATALYRAVLANRPTATADRTAFAITADCQNCGDELRGRYDKEFVSISCPSCESQVGQFTYPFPKNGLPNRDDDAVVRAVHQRAKYHVGLARTGQCPFCAGTTAAEVQVEAVESAADDGDPSRSEGEYEVEITCGTCSFLIQVDVLFTLLLDASVMAALVEIGVPVDTAYKWELPTPTIQIRSRDPVRVALEVESGGRTATVVVDGDLDVRSVAVDGETVGTA